MANDKLRTSTDQRPFTIIYNDFLESGKLDCYEKLIFIVIKKFADYKTLRAFPSVKTIAELSGLSRSTVKKSLKHMKTLGVLTVEPRESAEYGHQSNLYTLNDFRETWQMEGGEDDSELKEKIQDQKEIARLRARGFTVVEPENQKKVSAENVAGQSFVHSSDTDTSIKNNNYSSSVRQEENCSIDEIQDRYSYECLKERKPEDTELIDAVMDVILDVYNKKGNMRINGSHVAASQIRARYEELEVEDILYVVEKFKEQGAPIKRYKAYLRTMLYNAHAQRILEETNQNGIEASKKSSSGRKPGFKDFHQNEYDFEELEKKLNGE